MKAFLRLIRIENLLMVAASQYLMRFCIIRPMLILNNFNLQLGEWAFGIMVFATVCIAAAGYVINDYFDAGADELNRPGEVIIGKKISEAWAWKLYFILSGTGVLLGSWVTYLIHLPSLSLAVVLVTGLLWFYSSSYKRIPLLGNLIISLFTALVPLSVAIVEIPLLNSKYGQLMLLFNANFNYIFWWVGGFALFAFLVNLIREIVKDLEDFEGDTAYGKNSIAIAWGAYVAKLIGILVGAITVALIFFFYFKYLKYNPNNETDYMSLFYIVLLIIIPLTLAVGIFVFARSKKQYRLSSTLLKLVMLFGLGYAIPVCYTLHQFALE
jgi:4-hydroxybenzoate polyprenyltransferase